MNTWLRHVAQIAIQYGVNASSLDRNIDGLFGLFSLLIFAIALLAACCSACGRRHVQQREQEPAQAGVLC